jgi:hypothetical protein
MVGLGSPLSYGSQDLDVVNFLQNQFRTALALSFAWTFLLFLTACFLALVVLIGLAFGWNVPNSIIYVLALPGWFTVAGTCLNALRGAAVDTMRRLPRWRLAWESPDYQPEVFTRLLLAASDWDLLVQALAALVITALWSIRAVG